MKLLPIFMLLVLAFSPVLIQSVQTESISIENSIELNKKVNIAMTFVFDKPIYDFSYPLSFRAKNLEVSSNYEINECEVVLKGRVSDIVCSFLGLKEKKPLIKFEFEIENPSIEENRYSVLYYIIMPTLKSRININLPPSSSLAGEEISKSFSPPGAEITTDGKSIQLGWERSNLSIGDNIGFSVFYTSSSGSIEDLIGYFIIIVIIIIIGVFVWTIVHSKRAAKKSGEAVVSVLSKDEKILYDILVARGGKANQKVLVRESNLSKAKVSRTLKELKERGIVEIEPVSGRENRVLLKISQEKRI